MNAPPSTSKALVTGASSGIGAALSRRLAARGVEVWVAARRAERLTQLVADITAAGGKAHTVVLDVSDPTATAARVLALDSEVGGFDLVVANAGVGGGGNLARNQTVATLVDVFNTNVLGACATLQPLVQPMLARGRGHLVGVSSLAGEIVLPVSTDYGASKAAFSYWLEALQMDLAQTPVDVTLVHPGFVKSEMTDKNDFDMPFLLEQEAAIDIIDSAIQKRSKIVRFPTALVALLRAGNLMPSSLRTRMTSKNVRGPQA
jgi:short-subunit dehydrogenase